MIVAVCGVSLVLVIVQASGTVTEALDFAGDSADEYLDVNNRLVAAVRLSNTPTGNRQL